MKFNYVIRDTLKKADEIVRRLRREKYDAMVSDVLHSPSKSFPETHFNTDRQIEPELYLRFNRFRRADTPRGLRLELV